MVAEAGDRRERLADAAIATLARAGMRGLTHRAVDEAAGLPEGSTSYYLRTRLALLQATVERLAEVDMADVDALPSLAEARSVDEIADALTEMVTRWLTIGRDRMLARYELALEANRRPELRTVLVAQAARFRAAAEAVLAAAGARDAAAQAPLLAAYVDGLVFDHIAGGGALDLDGDELRAALRALVGGHVRTDLPTP